MQKSEKSITKKIEPMVVLSSYTSMVRNIFVLSSLAGVALAYSHRASKQDQTIFSKRAARFAGLYLMILSFGYGTLATLGFWKFINNVMVPEQLANPSGEGEQMINFFKLWALLSILFLIPLFGGIIIATIDVFNLK